MAFNIACFSFPLIITLAHPFQALEQDQARTRTGTVFFPTMN